MESAVHSEATVAPQIPLIVYVDQDSERRQAAEFVLNEVGAGVDLAVVARLAEAEPHLNRHRDGIAVLIVSYPVSDGDGLIGELERLRGRYPTVPIIAAFPPGVSHLTAPVFSQLVFQVISHDKMFAEAGAPLHQMVLQGLQESARRRVQDLLGRHTAQILASANRLWEKRTHGYIDRMLALWEWLAPYVAVSLMDREMVRVAIALYSIPDRYTTTERSEDGRNRRFSAIASGMLGGLDGLGPVRDALADLNEDWDGGGVPAGKKGEQISLLARLIAPIDAFDEWVVLDHLTPRSALERLKREDVKREDVVLFDPQVVTAFGQMMRKHGQEVEELYRVR